jgi:hypothetical protein
LPLDLCGFAGSSRTPNLIDSGVSRLKSVLPRKAALCFRTLSTTLSRKRKRTPYPSCLYAPLVHSRYPWIEASCLALTRPARGRLLSSGRLPLCRLTVDVPGGSVAPEIPHLEDDEANRANLYTDLHNQTHLERRRHLDGCRRFASASTALRSASSGGEIVWPGEQPRERRPPAQNRTYSDCLLQMSPGM